MKIIIQVDDLEKEISKKTKLESEFASHRTIQILLVVISLKALWLFMEFIRAEHSDMYILLLGDRSDVLFGPIIMTATVMQIGVMVWWIYLIHTDLHKIFPDYPLTPIVAAILWLPYIEVLGVGITISIIMIRLIRHMGRFEKCAGLLLTRTILYYGSIYLTGLEHDYDYTQVSSLPWDVGATWVLPNMLVDVAAIMLVAVVSAVLRKTVRLDDIL